jgi:uncharacterized protein YndB with AHSA1/START domain
MTDTTDSITPKAFTYVTYIRTTPEKLWEALLMPEFTKQYWVGAHHECDWTPGAPWRLVFANGQVADQGHVIEIDPPRKLVLAWQNEFMPEMKAEGPTRCTITLEPDGDVVKLTVHHASESSSHKFIDAVSGGWPMILSHLKTLLETGKVMREAPAVTPDIALDHANATS